MDVLCKIRDLQKALEQYEQSFEQRYGLCLKEAMVLCCVAENQCSPSNLASMVALTNSNCSKIINSAEKKGLIQRKLAVNDKRKLEIALTDYGQEILCRVQCEPVEIPQMLKKIV